MKKLQRCFCALMLGGLFAAVPLLAQEQDLVGKLVDRIVAGEQEFLAAMKEQRPILETYLQETGLAPDGETPVTTDHYMIGRLDLSHGVDHVPFVLSPGFQKPRGKKLQFFWRRSAPQFFMPRGFAQMVVLDAQEFSRDAYRFEYVRREFLGEVRALVFDVAPKNEKAAGKFIGRIWVDDRGYRIVRFNGTYTNSMPDSLFFHFDSWRAEAAPGFWAPAFVYVEDANIGRQDGSELRFKAQTRLWGYTAHRSDRLQELTDILIEPDTGVKDESPAENVSPLESHRAWTRQAEENVIQRLEKSGLLAPAGEVDKVLDTVVQNLMVTNGLQLDVRCRVLLTTPLETFSIGQAIVISRGLLDVLPDEASLAMVLSDELAHIALGHRTETMYAFSDQTMFADEEILERLRLSRGPEEMAAASLKAVEILARSPYKEKLSNAGLFLKALASRAPVLPNLIQANLGNQLASGDKLLHLGELAGEAPVLDEEQIDQMAALPLGSRIRLDSWTNRIQLIKAKPVELRTARDKMPFEVTPFVIHLSRLPPSGEPARTADNNQDGLPAK